MRERSLSIAWLLVPCPTPPTHALLPAYRYDKYWGSLSSDGMIPGGPKFAAPIYHCPLDHVLEPGALHLEHTAREWSFLQNPRMPASFNTPRKSVRVNGDGSAPEAQIEVKRLRSIPAKVLEVHHSPALPIASHLLLDVACHDISCDASRWRTYQS